MSETSTSEDPATQEPAYSKTGGAKRQKYWNPPELEWWQWLFYFFGHLVGWGAFLFLVGAYGWIAFRPETLPQIFCRHCLLVIPIVFILGSIFLVRWVRYNRDIHEEMVQNRSFVEALIEDAKWTAERLKSHSKSKTEYSDQRAVLLAEAISSEINRLTMVTPEGWTYYQTLYLDQLLVDAFDNEEELKARAELTLTSLEDYVKGSSWDFDRDKFEEWEARLKVVTDPVNTNEYWFHRVQTEDWDSSLKARLRLGKETLKTLMDYVADIESDWSYGSVILRNLKFCSNSTIVALLPISFLPVICPWGECSPIGWFEWGVFGIIGALLSVLRQLQRSDVIELGNTEGRREFMRAFVGGGLGLIAGLVAFAIVNAELVSSPLLPYQGDNKAATLYLPVIWAIASGFMFENVFERVKAITRMRNNDDN